MKSDRICFVWRYDLGEPGRRVRNELKIDWAQGLGKRDARGGGFVSQEY